MNRKGFIKAILGTTILFSMDGFSTMAAALSTKNNSNAEELATYGAIHLNITSLQKSIDFWTRVVGMKLRKNAGTVAELGTESKTLVVIHQAAKTGFKKGYSGLYHLAIHAPNAAEFASMYNRLLANNYPHSPVDHTMSKSFYLDDPDGINVEFTLETPERFKRVISEGGLKIEATDGSVRSASAYLDVNAILKNLVDKDITKVISKDTYIGHIHLYANNVTLSNEFYIKLGFNQFNYLPQYAYADVGAGGNYKHRIAMNSWHGNNRPLAPSNSAGMRQFEMVFKTREALQKGLNNLENYEEKSGKYEIKDPTGNTIILTSS